MSLCSLGDVTISSAASSDFSNQSRQAIEDGAEVFARVIKTWLRLIGRISLGLRLEETWDVRFYFRGHIVVLGTEHFVGEILFGHLGSGGHFENVRCLKVDIDPKEFWDFNCYIKSALIVNEHLRMVREILAELKAGSLEI